MFIDAHCHMQQVQDEVKRQRIIKRATEADVSMITCCHDSSNAYKVRQTLAVAEEYENIYPAFGLYYFGNAERLHKHGILITDEIVEKAIDAIGKMVKAGGPIVAMGEVGLDYSLARDENEMALQRERFTRFVKAAKEFDLPLIIHSCANSASDLLQTLKDEKWRGLLHGFQGTLDQAKEALALGCLIGVWPKVTYAKYLQNYVKHLPVTSLALESDTPHPSSPLIPGMAETEPAAVVFAAGKIAEIKKMPLEEVEATLTSTTRNFFRLGDENQ